MAGMSDHEPLFRQEAVDYQRKKASAADLVRLSAGWAKLGFWLVLVAVVAIVVATSVARVERVALAIAAVEGGEVTALLPAGQGAPPLEGSAATFLPRDGGGEQDVRVVDVEEAVSAEEARERFPDLALAIAGPVIVVGAEGLQGDHQFGRLRVKTGSEPVIVSFVPGLRELFGES